MVDPELPFHFGCKLALVATGLLGGILIASRLFMFGEGKNHV